MIKYHIIFHAITLHKVTYTQGEALDLINTA